MLSIKPHGLAGRHGMFGDLDVSCCFGVYDPGQNGIVIKQFSGSKHYLHGFSLFVGQVAIVKLC